MLVEVKRTVVSYIPGYCYRQILTQTCRNQNPNSSPHTCSQNNPNDSPASNPHLTRGVTRWSKPSAYPQPPLDVILNTYLGA
jgi:hypothetical protein